MLFLKRFLVILMAMFFSFQAFSEDGFKRFGKCDSLEIQAGCSTYGAGMCDPYNGQGCLYQCWCPKTAQKKLTLIHEILLMEADHPLLSNTKVEEN